MVLKKMILSFFLLTIGMLQAENLVFSGTPAAGREFLCTFSIKENISRKMEIRGAKEPPVQVAATDFVLTGLLKIRQNDKKAFIFQFIPDSFIWLDAGKQQNEQTLRKVGIDVALDATGALRLCRVAPDQRPDSERITISPALQNALLQLGRSLRAKPNAILGPDAIRKTGDFWQVDEQLISAIAKNRDVSTVNKSDWDSKVLFTRQEKFFDVFVNRIDVNLFTNRIPGYDCRLNMTYLFPVVDAKNTGAVSYIMDWMECVDKMMLDSNPIFSGTKIVEIKTLTVRRDLVPAQ